MRNSHNTFLQKKAFTLMEILVTVIIVGVISSIALVNYGTMLERAKAKEGEQLLLAIWSRARAAALEYGHDYSAGNCPTLAKIGIDIPSSNYFGAVTTTCWQGAFNVYYNTLQRNGNLYRLRVMNVYSSAVPSTGGPVVECSSGTGICNKIGFVEALIPF